MTAATHIYYLVAMAREDRSKVRTMRKFGMFASAEYVERRIVRYMKEARKIKDRGTRDKLAFSRFSTPRQGDDM